MPPSRRSPVRGSVGNEAGHAPTAVEDPDSFDDPEAPWGEDDEHAAPLGERIDMVRRKYMPLPDEVVYEFLGEDEYVVHSDHPSFRAFLTQNMALVILIPIVGPLLIFFMQGGITREAVLVFLVLDFLVAILALKRLGDRYTSYVITNLRLIKVTGIISRKLASIPWTRMTGLGYEQTALGRVLGYASIFIESANEESGLRKFSDVNDPATFHQRLLDMVSAKSGQTGRQPPPPTTGQRQSLFQKRKERKRIARDAEAERGRRRAASGTAERKRRPAPTPSGPPTPPAGEQIPPDQPTPPAGTPAADQPLRARPKVPGRGPGPGPSPDPAPRPRPGPPPAADVEPETSDLGDIDPAAATDEEADEPRRGWSWWPGTGGAKAKKPPIPPRPGEAETKRPPKRRRRPDQRAPSQRPPETIIVPRSEQVGERGQPPPKPRRPRRFREIEGWQDQGWRED